MKNHLPIEYLMLVISLLGLFFVALGFETLPLYMVEYISSSNLVYQGF
jgi:hypothetical protein